jgi:hypothetical protein
MSIKYTVFSTPFAEKYFIKKFEKKYKTAWDITYKALLREFQSIEVLFNKSIAEIIKHNEKIKICKTEFKIAGTNKSRHASGNRCILAIHEEEHRIYILLVYHKNDLKKGNETAEWEKIIKNNYPEYKDIIK